MSDESNKWEDTRIVVGIPTGNGMVSANILVMWDKLQLPAHELIVAEGCYVDRNRNDMVKYALDGNLDEVLGGPFTHFLMWDSDSIPRHADTVLKLLEADVDMIYAVAAAKQSSPLWLLFEWTNREECRHRWKLIADPHDPYDIYPKYKDKVFEVDGGGTGMCLIKREVFEKVEPPWYENVANPDFQYVGDDVSFHKKVQDANFHIFAHGGRFCFHKVGNLNFPDCMAEAAKQSISLDLVAMINLMK